MPNSWFTFKKFTVHHDLCAHKVGTDGVLLGAWAHHQKPQSILDIGSGSCLISLMLAQRFPLAHITSVEIHLESFTQGKQNINQSPFSHSISSLHGDFLQLDLKQQFDLIVSNPPFFKGVYSSGKQERDQARHEHALPHEEMLKKAAALLKPGGHIALVLPTEEADLLIAQSSTLNLYLKEELVVLGHPSAEAKRKLILFSNNLTSCTSKKLVLRNESNQWSEDYKALTRDFYLNI